MIVAVMDRPRTRFNINVSGVPYSPPFCFLMVYEVRLGQGQSGEISYNMTYEI